MNVIKIGIANLEPIIIFAFICFKKIYIIQYILIPYKARIRKWDLNSDNQIYLNTLTFLIKIGYFTSNSTYYSQSKNFRNHSKIEMYITPQAIPITCVP